MSTLLSFRAAAAVVLALCVWTADARAQQIVIVQRNVTLRRDPSTNHPAIRRLAPPEELELQETAKTNNYYHVVRAESQDTGWVWANNVRIDSTGQADTAMTGATLATTIDPGWQRPVPVSGTF